MLTIDDINSIFEKYTKVGFWEEIDLSKINMEEGAVTFVNGKKVEVTGFLPSPINRFEIVVTGNFLTPICYLSHGETILERQIHYRSVTEINLWLFQENVRPENLPILHIYNVQNSIEYQNSLALFIPLQSLVIMKVNGEYDDKFYIKWGNDRSNIMIDGEIVEQHEDDKGIFVRLPPYDCIIGSTRDSPPYYFNPMYPITFKEFKTLPTLSIPTIYKGNTQTIQLFNDTEEITEFQAYYKGELLTDNKITLPYDADDYIDITVDLLDNRYPNSILKLKAPTQMYSASTQSEVESAIANGITTLQVGDTETEVLLNGIDLTQVTLVNSNIQLTNSTLNNCTILNSQYTDNGANTITNTVIRNTDYTNTSKSTYEDTSFYNTRIQDSELQLTGTIYECELTNSLIISDGTININNNTFIGIGSKTYFPSHLYLTGDYIVSGNTFNLTGTFTELQFNMCLIKATTDFNVGDFINKNTFQLNIEYGTENPSTLYYNIVDDDKIRARRI